MKVVTLRGTYEVSLEDMKVRELSPQGRVRKLRRVPSPVVGERMSLETDEGIESTEQVTEVQL